MQRLIIKTGSALPALRASLGDYHDWIAAGLGAAAGQWQVVDVVAGERLPDPATVAGAVVSGSPAMVSERARWSVATAAWLRQAHALGRPLLGICYGHQLLADALGGEVGYHPGGPEVGFVPVCLHPAAAQDALLGGLPECFDAAAIHWQTVKRLPPGARLLAGNAFEPHHAFRLGNSWGVQFHPEFSEAALRAYFDLLEDKLQQAGLDVAALRARQTALAPAASLLGRFAALTVAAGQAQAPAIL